jgi:hypothetical protein
MRTLWEFPIWMYPKPLQARNVAYCNRMPRPPVSSASEFISFFLVSEFLSLDSRPFSLSTTFAGNRIPK